MTDAVSSQSPRQVTVTSVCSDIAFGEQPRPLVGRKRVNDRLQIATQHFGQPVDRESDAMIGHAIFLVVVCANFLAAPTATGLGAPGIRHLFAPLPLGQVEQP